MPTLLLNKNAVRDLLKMSEVIPAIEQAFRDWAEGRGKMPAKSYLLLDRGDFRAMPASLPGAVGIKWVNVHPENPGHGLPTVMAVIIYNDPGTGYPLAIIDGTDITAYRTGATAAIAAKYLARKDARTLGVIGTGRQAYTQILAHAEFFDLKQIKAYDIYPAAVDRLIKSLPRFPLRGCSLEETAASDIVCTLTPVRVPILKKEWVQPGTHINAIGADAAGKEELEPSLLKEAIVVVDDLGQASAAGEINVPIAKGLYSLNEVYGTLGAIVAGQKPGRKDKEAITIFDATGLAIEDVAIATIIYRKAKQAGTYQYIDLI